MAPKHTPGPWRVRNNLDISTCDVDFESEVFIASATGEKNTPQAESIANADLIAAAPDLFEALRKIAEHDYTKADESKLDGKPTLIWQAVARDAIKKVTDAN